MSYTSPAIEDRMDLTAELVVVRYSIIKKKPT